MPEDRVIMINSKLDHLHKLKSNGDNSSIINYYIQELSILVDMLLLIIQMISFDEYTYVNKKEHNPIWPYIPDHPYRILIIEGL